MEQNYFQKLRQWREERNLPSISREVYVKQILEELFELYALDKDDIKEFTEMCYSEWFEMDKDKVVSDSILIDSAEDIKVFSSNFVELLGYDTEKCGLEVIKEISAREQCPKQKAKWEEQGNQGEKWQKNPDQDADTLYQADFSKCKLKD